MSAANIFYYVNTGDRKVDKQYNMFSNLRYLKKNKAMRIDTYTALMADRLSTK